MTSRDAPGCNDGSGRMRVRRHHGSRAQTPVNAPTLLHVTGLLEMTAISSSLQLIAREDEGSGVLESGHAGARAGE